MTRALISAAQRTHSLPPRRKRGQMGAFPRPLRRASSFGLSDRDFAVLDALLTFHRSDTLSADGDLIVFPSNRAFAERAHGMSESTLRRRHLAALVDAGVVGRQDSPDGKRYAARNGDGIIVRAFDFDLSPLLGRASKIPCAARAAADILRPRREENVLRLRDCAKLIAYASAAPMLGITLETLQEARSAMWQVNMAISVACILQRAAAMRSPGGYLRALARKAERVCSLLAQWFWRSSLRQSQRCAVDSCQLCCSRGRSTPAHRRRPRPQVHRTRRSNQAAM